MTRRNRHAEPFETEDVVIKMTDHGAVIRPRGWDRLDAATRDDLEYLEATTTAIRHAEGHRRDAVELLREAGVSWHLIGLACGTTGDAARRRYGAGLDAD